MRNQATGAPGAKRRTAIMIILLAAIAVFAVVAVFLFMDRQQSSQYIPPVFEAAAVDGTPDPPKELAYTTLNSQVGYSVGVCGNIYQQEDGALKLYLTNPEFSEVLIMAEVVDKAGNVYYKSGLLRENQYVESLPLLFEKLTQATDVEVKIYAFEPDTYYSMGVITLDNVLQPY